MAFIKEKFQKKKKNFFKLLMNEQGLKCLSYFGRNHGKIYQKKKIKIQWWLPLVTLTEKFSKFRPADTRQIKKKKFFFFKMFQKYLWITIEVYGEKGYIELYHTQIKLDWNIPIPGHIKIIKYLEIHKQRWLTGSYDPPLLIPIPTRWLNPIWLIQYSCTSCSKISQKIQQKIK